MFKTLTRWFLLFATIGGVTLVGVVAFFRPIAESDAVQGPPVPAPVAFAIYVVGWRCLELVGRHPSRSAIR